MSAQDQTYIWRAVPPRDTACAWNSNPNGMTKQGHTSLLRVIWFLYFQNVTANHRANDVIAAEDGPQVLVGRFMYGPLDMVALTGEKVLGSLAAPSPGMDHLGRAH